MMKFKIYFKVHNLIFNYKYWLNQIESLYISVNITYF